MRYYAVNYLENSRSNQLKTIFVKANSEEEARDKAYDMVGGFYDATIDIILSKRAERIAIQFT